MRASELEEVRPRLGVDTPFYAETCLYIVDKRKQLVPLVPRPGQLKLDAALEAQRAAGRPMRAIVLKARQMGFSTWVQAKMMQRITQRPFHNAVVLAHTKKTAGKLFEIGEKMHAKLPRDPALGLKPPIVNRQRQNFLKFGQPSALLRSQGDFGIDSSYLVDTAGEWEAGRGETYSDVHGSEVAFWPEIAKKLAAVLSATPKEPGTLVVLESTANGHNHFKALWDQAVAGENEWAAVFCGWWEDPTYRRPFFSDQERAEFEAKVGEDEIGEAEPDLIELLRAHGFGELEILEKLHWRRTMFHDPEIGGDITTLNQEYPATPEDAFMASARQVFSQRLVGPLVRELADAEPPVEGVLATASRRVRSTPAGPVSVPTAALWAPRTPGMDPAPWWRVWRHPRAALKEWYAKGAIDAEEFERLLEGRDPDGDPREEQYVVSADVAGGEENEHHQTAFHAVQVIDHRTREQVAEYRSRIDPDLFAVEVLLAAIHFGGALIAVEVTGGWGAPIARRIWRDWRYSNVYFRKPLQSSKEKAEDRLGWDTNRVSKQFLEDGARELLREGTHGIRSVLLAREMLTYVRDEKGRTGPEPGKFSDLLMAWMIGQQVAHEVPPRPIRSKRGPTVTSTKRVVSATAGY